MKTIQVTVADFREIMGLKSQVESNSLMNILKLQGHAVEVGKKRPKNGIGKPAVIYEIPQTVELVLFQDSDMTSVQSETQEVSIKEVEESTDQGTHEPA